MRIKKRIVVFLIIAVVLPIAVNFIVTSQRPNNVFVAGEGVDWLQFFGSYVGSMIASITSLWILYDTLRCTMNENDANKIHAEILDIKKELSERFQKYNVSEIINLDFVKRCSGENGTVDWKTLYCVEAYRLQGLYEKYAGLRKSAILLYSNGETQEEIDFFLSYDQLISQTTTLIVDLIKLYTGQSEPLKSELINKYSNRAERLSVEERGPVLSKAQDFLLKLTKDFRNGQMKLSERE